MRVDVAWAQEDLVSGTGGGGEASEFFCPDYERLYPPPPLAPQRDVDHDFVGDACDSDQDK